MTKLSPQARALLDAADGGDDPSRGDQSRIRAALFAKIGAGAMAGGAVAGAAGTGAAAAGAGVKAGLSTSILVKVAASALVVGSVAVGTYVATRSSGTSTPASSAAAQDTGAVAPPSPPPSTDAVLSPSEGAPPSAGDVPSQDSATQASDEAAASPTSDFARRSDPSSGNPSRANPSGAHPSGRGPSDPSPNGATSNAASLRDAAHAGVPASGTAPGGSPGLAAASPTSSGPTSTIEAETRMLREAQTALRDGRADSALAILDKHGASFKEGVLREERIAARVLALCNLGRVDEARAEGRRFLRESPRSPLAERVRTSCAGK
jgi:hypothetical protein